MNKYEQGKIYKLSSDESECFYIGSTVRNLCERLWEHRADIRNGRTITNVAMRNHNNIKIELIELFPCDSRKDLEIREGYYQHQHDKMLNKNIAGRSYQEYCRDNSEKVKEATKKWRDNNPEKVNELNEKFKEQRKIWRKNNPEIVDEINKKRRERYAAKQLAK